MAVAHPARRVTQDEARERLAALIGEPRRIAALARATGIASRAIAVDPAELETLDGVAGRNRRYHELAPALLLAAAARALEEAARPAVECLATSSCTGFSLPSIAVSLQEGLALGPAIVRTPVTEAGCAGGLVALGRAADFVRARPGGAALAAAVELCSLAFHPVAEDGNLTSTLIFGDGAGAAVIEDGDGPGLEIVDTASYLVPLSTGLLGFDLRAQGLFPVLSRELAVRLAPAVVAALIPLLGRHGLTCDAIEAWLIHPGGARILAAIEGSLGLERRRLRWSWDSLAEFGNTSSAAIFDVLRRYLAERRPGYAVVAAFGPGVAIELALVRGR